VLKTDILCQTPYFVDEFVTWAFFKLLKMYKTNFIMIICVSNFFSICYQIFPVIFCYYSFFKGGLILNYFTFFKYHFSNLAGKWGAWGGYSDCPVTCGNGIQYRYRNCDNPIPQFGGANCVGTNSSRVICTNAKCSTLGN